MAKMFKWQTVIYISYMLMYITLINWNKAKH